MSERKALLFDGYPGPGIETRPVYVRSPKREGEPERVRGWPTNYVAPFSSQEGRQTATAAQEEGHDASPPVQWLGCTEDGQLVEPEGAVHSPLHSF